MTFLLFHDVFVTSGRMRKLCVFDPFWGKGDVDRPTSNWVYGGRLGMGEKTMSLDIPRNDRPLVAISNSPCNLYVNGTKKKRLTTGIHIWVRDIKLCLCIDKAMLKCIIYPQALYFASGALAATNKTEIV